MSNKKSRSEPNLFGGYTHYDEKGRKTGRSEPGFFGGYINYDEKGRKTGRSEPGLFGGYTHYDEKGRKTGRSEPGLFGGFTEYDERGNKIGHTQPEMFGGYSHSGKSNFSGTGASSGKKEGCYIATCVYGSYDCAPVLTLRAFRDNVLARRLPGRIFIRLYYAVSPFLVAKFGNRRLFRLCWRGILDRFVAFLDSHS